MPLIGSELGASSPADPAAAHSGGPALPFEGALLRAGGMPYAAWTGLARREAVLARATHARLGRRWGARRSASSRSRHPRRQRKGATKAFCLFEGHRRRGRPITSRSRSAPTPSRRPVRHCGERPHGRHAARRSRGVSGATAPGGEVAVDQQHVFFSAAASWRFRSAGSAAKPCLRAVVTDLSVPSPLQQC